MTPASFSGEQLHVAFTNDQSHPMGNGGALCSPEVLGNPVRQGCAHVEKPCKAALHMGAYGPATLFCISKV